LVSPGNRITGGKSYFWSVLVGIGNDAAALTWTRSRGPALAMSSVAINKSADFVPLGCTQASMGRVSFLFPLSMG